ncbi:uncharacterized protein DUF1236 [Roseiarcus fermentans]|uniref:Uncharacterized protein DUF1236 n=1 Tax=Roseiarcus fermentans TaxID=1473586 RepID=A0A366F5G3_9HYPH|nr:DUF1236 domain-containing protein [Roseiarcus fermentans]RBP09867.1 uncharacterized protein DUF1236 [Roseiarcus fermentans]
MKCARAAVSAFGLGVALPSLALANPLQGAADAPGGPGSADAGTRSGRPVDPGDARAVGASQIAPDRAAQIAKSLLATAPPGAGAVAVEVGSPLPGNVDVQPLPASVTDLVPEYRGFVYAVAGGEVAIVKPSTRQIVEVITSGGGRP